MSPLRQKSLENNTAEDEGGDEMLKIRYKRYLAKLNLRWNLVTEEQARISKVRFKIINFYRGCRKEEVTQVEHYGDDTRCFQGHEKELV